MKNNSLIDFTLIIPTLGERIEEITHSFQTLSKSQYKCHLIIVAPKTQIKILEELVRLHCPDFEVVYIREDQNSSLPKAINQGLTEVHTNFWNWAGDDDRIVLSEIAKIVAILSSDYDFSLGVGSCRYFATKSKTEIINKASQLASKMIFWGPNLIPQPSVVFRTEAVRKLGGINPKYQLAFDQDLISRCLRTGKLLVHKPITSEYRWSNDTLTSKNRTQSLRESHEIRMQNVSNKYQALITKLMYPIVIVSVRFSDLIFRLRFRK